MLLLAANRGRHEGRARCAPSANLTLGQRESLRPGHGHEVDELLNPPEQRRLKVTVGAHGGQDPLPPHGDVTLIGVRPAEGLEGSMLDIDASRHVRPALEADASGLDCLPDVDERVAEDEDRARPARRYGLGDARLL